MFVLIVQLMLFMHDKGVQGEELGGSVLQCNVVIQKRIFLKASTNFEPNIKTSQNSCKKTNIMRKKKTAQQWPVTIY